MNTSSRDHCRGVCMAESGLELLSLVFSRTLEGPQLGVECSPVGPAALLAPQPLWPGCDVRQDGIAKHPTLARLSDCFVPNHGASPSLGKVWLTSHKSEAEYGQGILHLEVNGFDISPHT